MSMISSFVSNRRLIIQLTKRDIAARYKGSVLGVFWSFITPLIMLAVYYFVFGVIFKARWGQDGGENFAILLFTGLMFHSLLAESLTSAPHVILSKVSYVKKVVFPLEILTWVSVLTAFFNFIISAFILFIVLFIVNLSVPLTWFYLPLVVLPLFFICLGVSWALASLGVYLRDMAQLVGVAATLLLFLCPIFYPIEAIPSNLQSVILLNPLSFIVEQGRGILVFGNSPNFLGLFIYFVVALVVAYVGYFWFMKTKKGFADVL